MGGTVVIDPRFCGPPDSGNGGYTCGLLASHVSGQARVRLQAPPPLGRTLELVRVGDGVELRDGEQVVAIARPAPFEADPRPSPGLERARAAANHYPGLFEHAFPTCFVCGPQRSPGDGLRIFPGPTERPGEVACSWTPDPSLADASGSVLPVFVWAALDCPSGWAHIHASGRPAVLGEFAVRIESPVAAGEEYVLLGWQTGAEGRKRYSASALYTAAGERLASARATWIELR